MPGSLNYTYTKTVYLFSLNDLDSTSNAINLTSVGPLNYKVNRTFVNPVYDDAKKVVNYTMKYDYDQINPEDHY